LLPPVTRPPAEATKNRTSDLDDLSNPPSMRRRHRPQLLERCSPGSPLASYEQITSLLTDRPTHQGMDFETPVRAPCAGARVRAGQVIALTGNTGHSTAPHLHYQLTRGGRTLDPSTTTGCRAASSRRAISPPCARRSRR
jgi:hypothetical protein